MVKSTRKIILISASIILWGLSVTFAQKAEKNYDPGQYPDEAKESVSENNSIHSLFDTIRSLSNNKKWVIELQNIVIRPSKAGITDTLPTLRGEAEFLNYKGLIIHSIHFVKADVFGTTLMDTTSGNASWLEKTGNSIHVYTSNRILERHLLFNTGDTIDPRILADNERLYRDQNYIEDAKILVEPLALLEGYADVIVIVKDQWSKAFYVELSDINAGRVELWDRNIFGTGNEIQNNFHWDPAKSDTWGYEAIYSSRNIMGSFINSRFHYTNIFENEGYGLQFNRRFFTPNTKYAGGALASHQSSVRKIWNYDSGYVSRRASSNISDIWIGRAIKLNKNAGIDKNRLNLILATRFYKVNFFDKPKVERNLYYEYHDKSVWLNTFALSSQSFYQSSLIYNYGRTEDIPIGSLLNVTFGPEFGEFENRIYASISYAKGNYISSLGYLYFQFGEGGFITDSGGLEQAMFQLRIKYFSNLFIYGQFKFRQFINFSFTKGIKRFEDEGITINERNGIRGFNIENVSGQKRFVMSMENVMFSPWYISGFRFSFFSYIDFALLGPEASNIIYEDVYSGIGIGTRIINEKLVFPTFSLRFGFYPNLKEIPVNELIHFSGEPRLNPNNFYQTNPAMMDFL